MAKKQSTTLSVEQITELFLTNCCSKKLERAIRAAAKKSNCEPREVIGSGAYIEAYRIILPENSPLVSEQGEAK